MKTISDDLFRLIKSLTRSEKGYFKKFASRNTPGEKNNYILLFDAVEEMDRYDEEILRKKLKNAAFMKQLPVYKNYLFNLILKSLQSYSAYETVDSNITGLIQNSNMLFKKTLYKEALKLLKKAKAIAEKHENTKALLEILAHERSIIMTLPDKNIHSIRAENYNRQLKLLSTLEKHFKLAWLSDLMVMFIEFEGDFRSAEKEKEMKKIISDPILKNYNSLDDYTSKKFFLHIHLFEQFAKEDLKKIQHYLYKEIELTQEYKHMIPGLIRSYIHTLVNYLMFSNLLKDREGVRTAIRYINELKRKIRNNIPLDIEVAILSDTAYAEIIIYRNNGEMRKGRITAGKIEEMLKSHGDIMPNILRIVLLVNTSVFYFIDANYTASLKLINLLINETPPSFKRDIYDFSRLFQLLIHFELGNYDVLENSLISTYRFLKQRKSIFAIETAMFNFFKRALRIERNRLKPVYEELLYELEKSADDTQSRLTLSNFNFIRWAKSKIEDKSIIDLIKEKN